LLALVLGYKLYYALKEQVLNRVFLYISLLFLINLINMETTNDPSLYMFLFASGILLASLFVYEFSPALCAQSPLLKPLFSNILFSTRIARAGVVSVLMVLAFFVLDVGSKIDFLLHGELIYTSAEQYKYPWFFWEKNGVISAFFVLAVAGFWLDTGYRRIVLIVAGLLFAIHISASEDLQIIRGILYFLPLYYLVAVIALSRVRYANDWYFYFIISTFFVVVTLTNVPKEFYWGPGIKSENNYIEYSRLYASVKRECPGRLVIEAAPSSPFIAKFYGIDVDYVLSSTGNAKNDTMYVADVVSGGYRTVLGSIPILTTIDSMQALDSDICLILRIPSKQRYVSAETEERLMQSGKRLHFSKIDLYLVDKNQLKGLK